MTEYTEFIEDGTVTTAKDFIKLCSRKYGVYETSKEEPLSPEIPVTIVKDPSFQAAVDTAKETLDEAIHCTDWETKLTDKITALQAAITSKETEISNIETSNESLKAAYAAITEELKGYTPDSPYNEVKKFAENQIALSLKFLPSTEKLSKEIEKLQSEVETHQAYEAADYKEIVLKDLSEKLASAIAENMKEDQRIAKRQEYLDGLWDSIQDL